MVIAITITGVAFAAFCIWLTVRIVNRKQRWAKWTLLGVVGLPVLYVASFGPVGWLVAVPYSADESTHNAHAVMSVYCPIGHILWITPSGWSTPSGAIMKVLEWWVLLGVPTDHCVYVPKDFHRHMIIHCVKP